MLDPSNEYVEKVCISLIREYLIKQKYSETLKSYNRETAHLIPTIGYYGSRLALATDLGMEGLMKLNKDSDNPFHTLLGVLVKSFIQDRELFLRSNFANSYNQNQRKMKKEERKSRCRSAGPHHTHSHKKDNNNSSSSTSPSPERSKTTEAESYESHPRPPKMKSLDIKIENKNLHHKIKKKVLEKTSKKIPPPVVERESKEIEEKEIHPMILFCEKLKQDMANLEESKILNYGKGSLSLDQHENLDEEESKSNSLITESNYDSHKQHNIQLLQQTTTVPPITNRSPKMISRHSVSMTLGQNLLETKQNLLAQVSLSPEENEIRQQVQINDPTESSSSSSNSKKSQASGSTTVTTDQGFKIREMDSLESFSSNSKNNFFQKSSNSLSKNSTNHVSISKTLDSVNWKELKEIVLGERGIMQDGWIGQGFVFSYQIPYGLVQKKGGPCGVLAVVQALILRNLMFGSEYCSDPSELPLTDFYSILTSSSSPKNLITSRTNALIGALVEILWKCGRPSEDGHNQVIVGFTSQGGTFGLGTGLHTFEDLDDLKIFVEANLHRFDCIGLLYSAVLSRGVKNVQDDMDFSDGTLLGQHGYCTQELMNLLTIGRAISNAFDNVHVLGENEKILQGISERADIGLLSLFEHYNSCRVGSYLKSPKFPLWIICSESHFTLLFSPDMNLLFDGGPNYFDLFYYDGLARQEKIIKLTISKMAVFDDRYGSSGDGPNTSKTNNNFIPSAAIDDDLIPPLEKCIRTRWNGVIVNWNDTEPIL